MVVNDNDKGSVIYIVFKKKEGLSESAPGDLDDGYDEESSKTMSKVTF